MSLDCFQLFFFHPPTVSISVLFEMAGREIGYIQMIWKHIKSLYKPSWPISEIWETIEDRDDVKKALDRGITRFNRRFVSFNEHCGNAEDRQIVSGNIDHFSTMSLLVHVGYKCFLFKAHLCGRFRIHQGS